MPRAYRNNWGGERGVDNKEEDTTHEQQANKLLELLRAPMTSIVERLRAQGFPLDPEGRINPAAFKGIIPEDELGADLLKVSSYELPPKPSREITPDEPSGLKPLGKLLEVATTIAFNKLWYNERLVAVRTAKYDDYINGVDEIVFDVKTGMPLAMVDATLSAAGKFEKIAPDIEQGAFIKYRALLQAGKVAVLKGNPQNRIPMFILSLNATEILELGRQCVGQGTQENGVIEREILKQLRGQSNTYPTMSRLYKMAPALKEKYRTASKVLENLG